MQNYSTFLQGFTLKLAFLSSSFKIFLAYSFREAAKYENKYFLNDGTKRNSAVGMCNLAINLKDLHLICLAFLKIHVTIWSICIWDVFSSITVRFYWNECGGHVCIWVAIFLWFNGKVLLKWPWWTYLYLGCYFSLV